MIDTIEIYADCVAKLESDCRSEGYMFKSCRSHKNQKLSVTFGFKQLNLLLLSLMIGLLVNERTCHRGATK